MKRNWMNLLGNWNPQLLRELKGRLKIRNILLAVTISLMGQFVLFMYFQTQLPIRVSSLNSSNYYPISHKYCTGQILYDLPKGLDDGLDNFLINWQLWSLDIFTTLSIISCFSILAAGTYLLISDLANEKRRDTLNFIRLSPQSPQSILWGKMLGVPILLYFAVLLAVPLHLWSGLSAKIPLSVILSFYAVMIAVSFLYYSGALLFGLVGSWLGGFQAWLGSGFVLSFLILSKQAFAFETSASNPFVVVKLINPYYLIPHPDVRSIFTSDTPNFTDFYWFVIPLGTSFLITACFAVFISLLGAYFIWQSLQRCYLDSNATMLTKLQSYLLTTCFATITIGCANWQKLALNPHYSYHKMVDNLACLLFLNLGLFLYLIAAVNPDRQTLQDWARYRHIANHKKLHHDTLIKDLIWGEKSPGILAIAINAMIAITCLSVFILVYWSDGDDKIKAFVALAFGGSLAVIYAALTQLLLFMKNEHRLFWASGLLLAVILVPPIILMMFFSNPGNHSLLWLFSVIAPLVALYPSGSNISTITAFLAILGHFSILGLLTFQLTRTLRKAGMSATKALLTGN